MKKRLLFLMLSACVLCAVSLKFLSDEEKRQSLFAETKETEETIIEELPKEDTGATEEIQHIGQNGETYTDDALIEEFVPGETDSITEGWQPDEYAYAYRCLDAEEQTVYREIYRILTNFGEDVELSITDPEMIGDIFQCVLNDYPEIFYVQGYTYTTYTKGEEIVRLTLSGTYTMTPEEAAFCREGIDAYTEKCLSGLTKEASDYEKVKYVYEYLINKTEYRQDSLENQNICSVFLNGESVCQGYAKATQYLLKRAGVFCTLVIGSVSGGQGHAWNLVQMDGNYYYVDTTWGDASYQMGEGNDTWQNSFPDINYDYLGVTTEQLSRTHSLNNVVPLPFCISMECNYYVQEGTYLTNSDEEVLKQLFETKVNQDNLYITLKCADETVYKEIKNLLIEEQKIFGYLHQSNGSVAYSDNDEQLSLSFWAGADS